MKQLPGRLKGELKMNQKVKVSKEIAELISSEVIAYGGSEVFLQIHAKVDTPWKGYQKPLNKITVWEMANILINGYEVEETPEEIVKRKYLLSKSNFVNSEWDAGFVSGINYLLEKMDIKIKGINE